MTNKQKELLAKFNRISEDKSQLQQFAQDLIMGEIIENPTEVEEGSIDKALGLDSNGDLVKGEISGGTKLYKHTIKGTSQQKDIITYTISEGGITVSTSSAYQDITINIISTRNNAYTFNDLCNDINNFKCMMCCNYEYQYTIRYNSQVPKRIELKTTAFSNSAIINTVHRLESIKTDTVTPL